MVAQIKADIFQHTSWTPKSDPSDGEGVQLAVETARGLEGEGEFAGAARWLQRAVSEAVRQGQFVRAQQLARAAAGLAEKEGPRQESMFAPSTGRASSAESAVPSSKPSCAPPAPPPTGSIPPLLAALISSMPPFSSRLSAEIPPPAPVATRLQSLPLRASSPPAARSQSWSQFPRAESRPEAASEHAANDNLDDGWPAEPTGSIAVSEPAHAADASVAELAPASHSAAERLPRVSAFRAAIPAPGQCTSSFFIQRLASGQRAPAGMVEAMIVVTDESESATSFEMSLGAAKSAAGGA
jgi:hypothetical protein